MSRAGLKAAIEFGKGLPSFRDLKAAEKALTKNKDRLIAEIVRGARKTSPDIVDFSADSLLAIEKWYFEQFERHGLSEVLATAIAFYMGEVAVRTLEGAEWVVEEYAFEPGKYEIGVRRGLVTVTLGSWENRLHSPYNKKHACVWRVYQKYLAGNPKVSINF